MKYNIIFNICFIAAFFFFFISPFKSDECKNAFIKNYEYSSSSSKPNKNGENFKWIIENRLSKYENELGKLNSALLNLIVLSVIGLLLILFRPKYIEVPFLSLKTPETIIYLTVIFGILYVWQNLGLQLNSSIDSRLSLYKGMEHLISDELSKEIGYSNQPTHILSDNGIVDNWCSFYFDIFNGVKDRGWAMKTFEGLGLFGLFGTLFGTAYGVCFISIIELGNRKRNAKKASNFLLLFAISLMIFANYAWVTKHDYASLFTSYYWLVAGLFIIWWKVKGIKLSERLTVQSDNP